MANWRMAPAVVAAQSRAVPRRSAITTTRTADRSFPAVVTQSAERVLRVDLTLESPTQAHELSPRGVTLGPRHGWLIPRGPRQLPKRTRAS